MLFTCLANTKYGYYTCNSLNTVVDFPICVYNIHITRDDGNNLQSYYLEVLTALGCRPDLSNDNHCSVVFSSWQNVTSGDAELLKTPTIKVSCSN